MPAVCGGTNSLFQGAGDQARWKLFALQSRCVFESRALCTVPVLCRSIVTFFADALLVYQVPSFLCRAPRLVNNGPAYDDTVELPCRRHSYPIGAYHMEERGSN